MPGIVEMSDLVIDIRSGHSTVRAVDGVSLSIEQGRTLGLVGESGCGKSTTGLAVVGLLPPGGTVVSGGIRIDGTDVVGQREEASRELRGATVGVVFQDPMTALNPTQRIGTQVAEPLRIHGMAGKTAALRQAIDMLGEVGLPRPAEQAERFPHELSGGMRQRVMIAIALVCGPKLLIADEPTTALDVTTQDQILQLFDSLQEQRGMAILLITHDMGVVAGHTDDVAVMYAGRIAELAGTKELFRDHRHRYTEALLGSMPTLDTPHRQRLTSIPGLPPNLGGTLEACRFAPRCAHSGPECFDIEPEWESAAGHGFACHRPRVQVPADKGGAA